MARGEKEEQPRKKNKKKGSSKVKRSIDNPMEKGKKRTEATTEEKRPGLKKVLTMPTALLQDAFTEIKGL